MEAEDVEELRERLKELRDTAGQDRVQSNGHDEHFLAGMRAAYDKAIRELEKIGEEDNQ